MAALKLAPAVLAAWFIGTRRWAALGWMAASLAAIVLLALVVAGPHSWIDYIDVARTAPSSPASMSSLSGVPFASYAMLGAFGVLSIAAGGRDGGSFVIAVVAFTLFTPAFYPAAMVVLPALALPIEHELRYQRRTASPG
jgi:hypothetical protein